MYESFFQKLCQLSSFKVKKCKHLTLPKSTVQQACVVSNQQTSCYFCQHFLHTPQELKETSQALLKRSSCNHQSSARALRRTALLHGLRTPNEAFCHRNSKFLGLGRQFGQLNFGAFGVFSANLSAPILKSKSLVHVFH